MMYKPELVFSSTWISFDRQSFAAPSTTLAFLPLISSGRKLVQLTLWLNLYNNTVHIYDM